jgi:hypothetical protein
LFKFSIVTPRSTWISKIGRGKCFSTKGQIINISDFASYMISTATIQLDPCNAKTGSRQYVNK